MLVLRFRESVLNLATFMGLTMKGTTFINHILTEVDFIDTDLTGSDFSGSTLDRTIFEQTTLDKCDFRSSLDFQIIPLHNSLKSTRFAKNNLSGLVKHLPIHLC